MIDTVLHLPYVSIWLPLLAAFAVAAPVIWLVRPARVVASAGAEVHAAADAVPEAPPPPKYAPEQRRSFRRGGNSIGLYYKHPGRDDDDPGKASIVDRSFGGICVMAPEAVPTGTVLAIRPTSADDIVPWVEIEVCTCRPADRCFELGCRFVKTPPYSILLLFG